MVAERIEDTAPMQVCTVCGTEYPRTAKYFKEHHPDQLRRVCRACYSERTRRYNARRTGMPLPTYTRGITRVLLLYDDLTDYLVPVEGSSCLRWRGHGGTRVPRYTDGGVWAQSIVHALWERAHGIPEHWSSLTRTRDCSHEWCVNVAHLRVRRDSAHRNSTEPEPLPPDIAALPLDVQDALRIVAMACGIVPEDLFKRGKRPARVRARWGLIWALAKLGYTDAQVGGMVGYHASTVCYARQQAAQDNAIQALSLPQHAAPVVLVVLPADDLTTAITQATAPLGAYQAQAVAFIRVDLLGAPARTYSTVQRLTGMRALVGHQAACTQLGADLRRFREPGAAALLSRFCRDYASWALPVTVAV